MAKDKILLKLLDEYKNQWGDRKAAFPYAIGCELHEFDYDTQLKFKKEHIRRLFEAKGFDVDVKKVHPSPCVTGYRNKMEYSFGDSEIGGELNLGMHIPNRYYDIVSTTDLYIVDDDFNKIVLAVQSYARKMGYAKFYKKDGSGSLRHLVVRKAKFTGEILIGISTAYDENDVDNQYENNIEDIKHNRKKGIENKEVYGSRFEGFVEEEINGNKITKQEVLEITKDRLEQDEFIENEMNKNVISQDSNMKEFDKEDFVRELLSINLDGKIVGIIHLKNNSIADVVMQGEDDEIIYGRDYYIEKILGLEFKVSFFSFFQTNSAGAEVLYSRVREIVRDIKPSIALDLFCGTGTISQILSDEADELIGIEIVEDAVKMAEDNAKINGIDNCHYIAGDVFKVLKENSWKYFVDVDEEENKLNYESNKNEEENNENKKIEKEEKEMIVKKLTNINDEILPDLIILDPPRSGVSQKALKKIIEFGVDTILYVSCNPRTLAIDYEILNQAGYEIVSLEAVDLYPCTKHCEVILVLSRK